MGVKKEEEETTEGLTVAKADRPPLKERGGAKSIEGVSSATRGREAGPRLQDGVDGQSGGEKHGMI